MTTIPATFLNPGQEYVFGTPEGTAQIVYWTNIDGVHTLGVHHVLGDSEGTIRIEIHNGSILGKIEARTSMYDRPHPLTHIEGDHPTLKELIVKAEEQGNMPNHIRNNLAAIRAQL